MITLLYGICFFLVFCFGVLLVIIHAFKHPFGYQDENTQTFKTGEEPKPEADKPRGKEQKGNP